MVDPAIRALVIRRAGNRCEYCHDLQAAHSATFNLDHVIASQHLEDDSADNLPWSCPACNRRKGPNLAGFDPLSRGVVRLFHPRTDVWADHFIWQGLVLNGLTPIGRATISVLDINSEERVQLRRYLAADGLWDNTG